MNPVDRFMRKMVKLFVEDWRFALAIAGWLLVTGLLVPAIGFGGGWAGLVLFAGLAFILVDSVRRQARR